MTDETCSRCLYRVCLCGEVPVIDTRTRVVIVRHHLETYRSSNTGRLAHFALRNSVLVDHGGRNGPTVMPDLEGAWIVYPAGEALERCPEPPPKQIVILDASWSQARRMFRKIGALRGLPYLQLATIGGARRLRAAPSPDRVSTIEAIAGALRLIEGNGPARQLEQLFDVAIDRAVASGLRVTRSPTLG